jgi:hypothetical protein
VLQEALEPILGIGGGSSGDARNAADDDPLVAVRPRLVAYCERPRDDTLLAAVTDLNAVAMNGAQLGADTLQSKGSETPTNVEPAQKAKCRKAKAKKSTTK